MFRTVAILASLTFIASCITLPANIDLVPYYQVETAKPYDDVMAELEVAIAEHNFRVTGHSRVGKVIRERGAENFPEYDTIQFCNLTLAKQVLEMTPKAIGYMPCNIVTYQQNGKTIIKTHLLPEDTDNAVLNRFARDFNPQLKQIVDFAASP
jgi:uncharacterized protein (DUF302 family)